VAPDLLDAGLRARLQEGKERAQLRMSAEARLPEHLLFVKGWPTVLPTPGEAALIAGVRRDVAQAVGLQVHHTDRDAVLVRYRELMTVARAKAVTNDLPLHTEEGLQT
jgi:hypothetical protein